jgi:hypothetical protein
MSGAPALPFPTQQDHSCSDDSVGSAKQSTSGSGLQVSYCLSWTLDAAWLSLDPFRCNECKRSGLCHFQCSRFGDEHFRCTGTGTSGATGYALYWRPLCRGTVAFTSAGFWGDVRCSGIAFSDAAGSLVQR